MIAIIDYGVGNLFSLRSSLLAINANAVVTNDPKVIKSAEKIILPGVGAFEDAAKKLRESGLADLIVEEFSAFALACRCFSKKALNTESIKVLDSFPARSELLRKLFPKA